MLHVSRSLSSSGARRGSVVAAVLIAAAALAGCDSSSTVAAKQTKTFTGAEGAAQTVVQDVAERAAKDDPNGICTHDLTPAAQAVFTKAGGTCAKGVKKALDTADSLQLDVIAVRVTTSGTAETAVAQIDTPDDIGTRAITLTRPSNKGLWKIDSFSATITPKGKSTSTKTADPDAVSTLPLTSP